MTVWSSARLRLILVATARPESTPDFRAIEAALSGGVTLLQIRGKGIPSGEFLALVRSLGSVCGRAGVPLVVNDRPDLARAAGAAGAHVGPEDLPPLAARKVLGPLGLGVSVRDEPRLSQAEAAHAEYLGVGALRSTPSKPEARVLGLDGIAALISRTSIPVVAIGGVRPEDVPPLRRAGAAGVAVASGILDASDPAAAAGAYRDAWRA